MIPKKIFTVWLNDNPGYPPLVERCIASQQIPGYEHHVITLENCDRSYSYVRDAISTKNWVKASDFIRCQYMYDNGGIYLDADMEVLPNKNFDALLDCSIFTCIEPCSLYANSAFGAEPGHLIIRKYIERVENNFKGTGDLILLPGIQTFHDIFWIVRNAGRLDEMGVKVVGTDYFFPYNHVTNVENITDNTLVKHHFMRSWNEEFWKSQDIEKP